MVHRQFTFSNVGRWSKPSVAKENQYSHWIRYNTFYGLVITTTLTTVLLAADFYEWRATGFFFHTVNDFPGTVALIVQLIASFFGLIHVAVVCRLINFALRIRLNRVSVSLDMLRTWMDMSIPRIDWDLPLRFFFPVMCIVLLSLVPSALWAGSIVPIIAPSRSTGMLLLPDYRDVSLIKEYPPEIGRAGPSLRNRRGLFTYSVGTQHTGNLLSSAASASSVGTRPRIHPKFDNTQYSYVGRSYGVGASVGLSDLIISSRAHVAGYIYQEQGYICNVSCIYNASTQFVLNGPLTEWVYAAEGNLPDSLESEEFSNYVGYDGASIVAIGVAHSENSPRKYLGIAAGENYKSLNTTQCEFSFTPTLFNITVDSINNNISVTPLETIPDFNPDRNLTRTVVRQFELMSNEVTSLYVSLLGDALNSSIAAFAMFHSTSNRNPISEQDAVLGGLQNSFTAMADDMLVSYASAQLMVGRTWTQHIATVYLYTMRFGQPMYIYLTFALNLAIVIAVAVEAWRTRGWKQLSRFNYLDPRDLIVAASRGGREVSAASDVMTADGKRRRMKRLWLLSDPDDGSGRLRIRLRNEGGHAAIVLGDGDRKEEDFEDGEERSGADEKKGFEFS